MFASVVVEIEGPGAPGPLTYLVPEEWRTDVQIGTYVRVPLGRREALGYVVGLHPKAPPDGDSGALTWKPLLAILHPEPLFDEALLRLATWMSQRYHAALTECLHSIVPEGLRTRLRRWVWLQGVTDPATAASSLQKRAPRLAALVHLLAELGRTDIVHLRKRWRGGDLGAALARLRERGWLGEELALDSTPVRTRHITAYAAAAPPSVLRAEAEARRIRAPAQARALDLFLDRSTPLTLAEARAQGLSDKPLRALAQEGLLKREAVPVRHRPWPEVGVLAPPVPPTEAQQQALAAIEEALDAGQHDTILLHVGIASGKMEIYLQAMELALAKGRGVIFLLPEIALTAQVREQFQGRFGHQVALLHSRLSEGERYDEWRRLRQGEARVAIGTRAALFAPLTHLGLILIEEEHDPSYKQETSPRYHARQVALQRARAADAVLVLTSATPSVESYFAASTGAYRWVRVHEPAPGHARPTIEVVDLRTGEGEPAPGVLSERLQEAIHDRLERHEQVILFLNRRGFARFLLCRDCGFTPDCPHCSVALVLHATDRTLRCHYCNHRHPTPTLCPRCRGRRLRPFGIGTQRVEAEVKRRFPQARVLRMDRDTTSAKDAPLRFARAFREGEANVLVGTQMVVRGWDFPHVTLVGVVAADVGLNLPDYRAAERTFQLLMHAAAQAAQGGSQSLVILQTFNPDHYAIEAVRTLDGERFYRQEVDFRRELGYPPFGALVNVLSADEEKEAAQARAGRAAQAMGCAAQQEGFDVQVLGPAPAPIARLKGRYRWHILVRGPDDEAVQQTVWRGLNTLSEEDRAALVVDVDPLGTG